VPLTVACKAKPDDAGCAWRRLILVRPDHHVAWHGDAMPSDPQAVIDQARGHSGNGGSAEKGHAAVVEAS